MNRRFFSSLTRISDLDRVASQIRILPREFWEAGDYVVGEVCCPPGPLTKTELPNGRYVDLLEGDQVMGAFGVRDATLEAVGDYRRIGDDLKMDALTNAGLFGKCTSISPFLPRLTALFYRGHVLTGGTKATMKSYVTGPQNAVAFSLPVVLLVGTSMSSGKTTCARIVIRRLKKMGLSVVAAKATGACRYGEILSMADAGADAIFDFVDVGLPSTVCPAEEFLEAFRILLSKMAATGCDAAVVELGASPLEPYNGEAAMRALLPHVRMTLLCASDPYAVLGVQAAYRLEADLVAGLSANTTAGVALIRRLAGRPALNLLAEDSLPALDALLRDRLRLWPSGEEAPQSAGGA